MRRDHEAVRDREQAFITAYLTGAKPFNATAAAVAAGFSAKTAGKTGCLLLQRPHIQAAMALFREHTRDTAILTYQEKAAILSEIARGRATDFVNVTAEGVVSLIPTRAQLNTAALDSVEVRREPGENGGEIVKVRLRNCIDAISELNKMQGHHAAQKLIVKDAGSIDNMGAEDVDRELARIDAEETEIARRKNKTG